MFGGLFGRSNEEKLRKAAKKGELSKVRKLLAKGVDVNASDGDIGTALHWASRDGHSDIVRELLGQEACDVNAVEDGWTALHWASSRGHIKVVHLLLGHKTCDVNALTLDRKTALHLASEHGRLDVVRALLSQEACDVNASDAYGRTALHWASWDGHLDVVRVLLDVKACDLNAQDKDDETALHFACWLAYHEVVRELLARGLNPSLLNQSGDTPLATCLQLKGLGSQSRKDQIFWYTLKTAHALLSSGATYEGPEEILPSVEDKYKDIATTVAFCVRHWINEQQRKQSSLTAVPFEVFSRGSKAVEAYLTEADSPPAA